MSRRAADVLHELSIDDLGVLESARVELGGGLTVVTGETGAGKTMVLTGLGLILGGKAVPATVRTGADEARAEAVLDVPDELRARLEEAGAAVEEDGTVIVARSVGATTRSRTVVGGRSVPQSLLADIAAELVTVHGQADQVRLRSAARQRQTLDAYAGADHAALLGRYRDAWDALARTRSALVAMEEGADASRAEVARLRDDLAAINEVDPQPGEVEALATEARVLENSEAVRDGVAGSLAALDSDADGDAGATVVVAVESARRALADAARHDDTLEPLVARLAELSYGATDIASELTRYLDGLDADPARLDAVHRRRSAIAGLERRLGTDLAGVIDHRDRAQARIADDDAWDQTLAERRSAVADAEQEVAALAAEITTNRAAAATTIAAEVRAELALLAMADADFRVVMETGEPGPHGADSVTMELAAHPGAPHRPVAEAASGGELSRIMLAIEVALAAGAARPGHTFVFDEVDAGVGGKAAVAVGERLAALAETHQVIVVTHLAQVAAFADTHIVVEKASDGAVTRAQVHPVDGDARVQEVARLLSGQEDSTTARAHAVELLTGSRVAP